MDKNISTLVDDIYSVIEGKGGWSSTVSQYFRDTVGDTLDARLKEDKEPYTPGLRMSNIGQPCARKLWYSINMSGEGEELRPEVLTKFLFGDILEDLLLSLAVAAGHTVEGRQDEMSIADVKGHRDAVIDGVTVDVKSASSYSFKKFKDHQLRENDPFGYISQLSSYVYAGKDDPLVKDKVNGGFLVIDKQHGHICLDKYDFTDELANKEEEYLKRYKEATYLDYPPPRNFSPEPEGKSGNMKLGVNCRYCDFKKVCYPNLRTFVSSRGPVYLTTVKKEPRMMEVK